MSSAETAPEQQDGNLGTILAAIVALLIAGAAIEMFVSLLMRLAGMHLEALRFLLRPYEELGEMVRMPSPPVGGWSEPEYQQYNQNVHRRASYLVNASRRMSTAYQSGGVAEMRLAYERERTYWRQHKQAQQNRMKTAKQVGAMMERVSEALLGWHAVLDERTSPECQMADGRNFNPSRIPPIGYPGSVHPFCRCRAGIPFATRLRVEQIQPESSRRTA